MKSDGAMVKRARIEDAEALAGLAIQMWTEHAPEDLAEEFRQLAMNDDAACFIELVGDKPIAFAQCQLRHDYVEGTGSSPVGYLEGILSRKDIGRRGMPRSSCQNARNGQEKRAVSNSPAIVSSAMRTA